MNLLLLQALATALDTRLRGEKLGTACGLPPLLSLPVGERHIVTLTGSPGPLCALASSSPFERVSAPERFAPVRGRRVAAVRLLSGDRVLEIETDAGISVIFYLYGAAARVVLRQGLHILEAFGRRGRIEDDTVPSGPSIVDVPPDALAAAPDTPVRGLEPSLREAFTSAGTLDAGALCRFRDDVVAGRVPFALHAGRSRANATPVPATGPGPQFDSAVSACAMLGEELLADATTAIVNRFLQPLRRRLAANRKLAANLEKDVAGARGFERIRREAETLAAFQAGVPHGVSTVELPDVYDPDQTVSIALDPSQPLHVQIEKRFRRATKLEKSLKHAGRRLELVRSEIDALASGVSVLADAKSLSEAMRRFEALRGKFDLEPPRAPRAQRRQSTERTFRRFELEDGWFVLVGRSNQENDELTFHRSAPSDTWLHAQGVPGSHVILKHDGPGTHPPHAVLERAASIAAHFSKARHSGLVPVIYTQRRYVRKFRGAAPGQVRCERERMIMVPPQLPTPKK